MKTINILIRIAQVLFGITGLSNAYGLFVHLALSATFGSAKLGTLTIIGTIITILVCGFCIFLLQRYYEQRNGQQPSTSSKKFAGFALSGVGVAAAIGVSIVMLIAAAIYTNL